MILKKIALWLGLFCFLFLLFFLVQIYELTRRPLLSTQSEPLVLEVKKNQSASSLAYLLQEKGISLSKNKILALINLKGWSSRLQAGVYEIRPGDSLLVFLEKVVKGDVVVETFRISEGSTLNHLLAQLSKAPFLGYSQETLALLEPLLKEQALQAKNLPSLEGLFLADTYQYLAGSTAAKLLRRANTALAQALMEAWKTRAEGLPYRSPYELLIAASILEKEAALPAERKLIAGVIVNRLYKRMPLQMDPTVIYGLGTAYHYPLSHQDLSVNSPYNTYRYYGLPPTPIAMVGKVAIESAAHPELKNFLYFVAKPDGSHHFSATYEEHKAAILLYRKENSKQETL